VLPFFRLLGYPDSHCRSKYPIDYNTGSQGRKREIDFVYFAVDIHTQQSAGTALIVVETKKSTITTFEEAIAQARSYCATLRPILMVFTNGVRLIILKRHRFHDDETVFDGAIAKLRTHETLARVYELVQFDILCALRKRLINELALEQLVQLDQTLQSYPDIRALLARGDFRSETTQNGHEFIVVRPKAAIEGLLPAGFTEGKCTISFSHILRRGLTIHLDHATILNELAIGLNSGLSDKTRRFIDQVTPNEFETHLGPLTTLLIREEAQDLCDCIDTFVGAYRQQIYATEDTLQTWDRPLIKHNDNPVFYLFSVRPWLWAAIRQFAQKFEWGLGNTEWHIFENYLPALRISHPKQDHAFIYGMSQVPHQPFFSHDYIHLFYGLPPFTLKYTADITHRPWEESVGPQGLWTLPYTLKWMEIKLIPKVQKLAVLQRIIRNPWDRVIHYSQWEGEASSYILFNRVENPAQLVPYLMDIHLWFAGYGAERIPIHLYRNVVIQCLHLARNADPNKLNLHYIESRIGGIEHVDESEDVTFQYGGNPHRAREAYAAVLMQLQHYVDALAQQDSEHRVIVDYRMRALITILEEGAIQTTQAALNQAADAIQTLWRQARFESRHAHPRVD
jgi:hypothetical protein